MDDIPSPAELNQRQAAHRAAQAPRLAREQADIERKARERVQAAQAAEAHAAEVERAQRQRALPSAFRQANEELEGLSVSEAKSGTIRLDDVDTPYSTSAAEAVADVLRRKGFRAKVRTYAHRVHDPTSYRPGPAGTPGWRTETPRNYIDVEWD